MEMDIDREGPTTPKRIIGQKRPIKTLQRPRANGARHQLVPEIPLPTKKILEQAKQDKEDSSEEEEEDIEEGEKKKEVSSLIYKAQDLTVKAASLTDNRQEQTNLLDLV